MRVVDKHYAIMTYGASNVTVSDPDGKIIFQSDERDESMCKNEELLKAYLKKILKMLAEKKEETKA